jgi:signal transduction histidine kinase
MKRMTKMDASVIEPNGDRVGGPVRVLLIEDNLGDARLVLELLKDVGGSLYEVTDAGSLKVGIRHLKATNYDVVLLDLSLPDGFGIETVGRLLAKAPAVPIVVLTGLDDDRSAVDAVRSGAQDYLVKGKFDGPMLARVLRYAIERARAQQTHARYQDQTALTTIATAVSQSLQLEEMLEIAVAKVLEVTGCEMAHIRLRNQTTGEISLAAHRGLTPERVDALLQQQRPSTERDEVFRTGEVVINRVPAASAHGSQSAQASGRVIVWIPLNAKANVVGILTIETVRRENFLPREVELLKAIGNVIGVGVENARLFTETRRQLERIQALRDISVATASSLNLSHVLKVLLEKIAVILPYSALAVRLFDKASCELRPTMAWNFDQEEWQGSTDKPTASGLSAIVFERKSPLAIRQFVNDPRTRKPEMFRRQGLVSYLGLPMIANGECVGVLSISTKFEHEFPDEEIRFLSALANQAGMAIYNSQLYEHIQGQATELERSNKVKDEFLSVMSHEFRTPINVILGYCDLIQKRVLGEVTAEQENALAKITDRSKDLLGLLSAILEVTRIETKDLRVMTEKFDLNEFFAEFQANHDLRLPKDVNIEWFGPEQAVAVNTDQRKLRIILEQLFANAVQFTESGKISVAVNRSADDKHFQLSVTDTGIGIPAESRELIFEKFTQLDGSSTRSVGGAGLGLYLVRSFVALLGGEVQVDSGVGIGSSFAVTLPIDIESVPDLVER